MHTFSHKCEVVGNPYLSIAFKKKPADLLSVVCWEHFFSCIYEIFIIFAPTNTSLLLINFVLTGKARCEAVFFCLRQYKDLKINTLYFARVTNKVSKSISIKTFSF